MEEQYNQFTRGVRRLGRRFHSFPAHKKLLAIFVLVLALPVAVYLVRSFTLYLSRAASAQLSFSPSQASLPPNSTLTVRANSGTAPIAFARVEVTFDRTKVNLSNEIQTNGPLRAVIGKTSRADANNTGRIIVVVALCNAIDIPCSPQPTAPSGSFDLFQIPFTSVTSQATSATVAFDVSSSQLVDTAQSNVTLTGSSATLNLNSTGATNTPRPTGATNTVTPRPSSSSTPRPSNTVTPRPTNSNAQADTTLSLTSSRNQVAVNQSLPVNVQINSGTNSVIGVDLDISFDPTYFTLSDITAGSFFSNPDTTNKVINNNNGTARITINIPPGSNARQGSGTLAVLNFRAVGEGVTRIDFGNANLVAAVNMNGQNALKTTNGFGVTVTQSTLLGDINEDGTVDIVDYVILFANFGKSATDPNADARADVNNDGRINILDYTYVFENFGRSI